MLLHRIDIQYKINKPLWLNCGYTDTHQEAIEVIESWVSPEEPIKYRIITFEVNVIQEIDKSIEGTNV